MFEANPETGEFSRKGVRVKLQELPFRLLALLLENPGEIVSRENVRQRLWPGNTFVDFDASLGVAVGKLREALGDDADNPRFIETIPRRGYRFVAPVQQANQSPELAIASPVASSSRPQTRRKAITIGITLAVLLSALVVYLKSRNQARLAQRDGIIVGDFSKSTGDPVFDGSLRRAVVVQLAQSPFFVPVTAALAPACWHTSRARVGVNFSQNLRRQYLPAKCYAGAVRERFTNRYFVDKFPMFLSLNPSSPPVACVSFVDPGLESLASFETHLQAYLPLFFQLSHVNFHYIAVRDTHEDKARELFMGHFQRHWNPDGSGGLVDYFCLRKRVEAGETQKLSTADFITHAEAKAKFNRVGIENLYQKWRSGQVNFDQVREEYSALRRPATVTFIFSPVNGQVALFERHPRTLVKTGRNSTSPAAFTGDFTSQFSEAER